MVKYLKHLPGQSEEGYLPMILTDAWTQQKVNGSTPLSIELSFKSYNNDSVASTNYHDILKFLSHICSPVKPIKFGTDTINLINRIGNGFIETGSEIIDALKSTVKEPSNEENISNGQLVAQYLGGAVNSINGLYGDITNKSVLGRNNGNFTVIFYFR